MLPFFKSNDHSFSLLQTAWSKMINPIVGRIQNQSIILSKISLINGTNVVNHGLGKTLTGWKIIRLRTPGGTVWDNQDSNSTPNTTLILISNANIVVDIEVF